MPALTKQAMSLPSAEALLSPDQTHKRSRKEAQRNRRQTKKDSSLSLIEKSWPVWVRKGAVQLDRAEASAIKVLPLGEDVPHWVCLMMREIWRIVGPDIRPEDNISGPAFLGRMVGHVEQMASGQSGLDRVLEALAKAERELNQKILGTLTRQQMAQLISRQQEVKGAVAEARRQAQRIADVFEVVERRKLKIGQQIQAVATRQPDVEKREFFEAYMREKRRKIFSEDGWLVREKATNERIRPSMIYFLMVFNWKVVDRFKNFGELRRWIDWQLGEGSSGDLARLRQLCQNHGYNPEGEPGRPKGRFEKPQVSTFLNNYLLMNDWRKK